MDFDRSEKGDENTPLVPHEPPREANLMRKLAVMGGCLMQQMVVNGIGYGLSVLYPELIVVFGSSRTNASLVQGIYMGICTGGGIIFTSLIRRFGPGRSIMVGAAVGTIGLFCSSFAKNLPAVIILTGVVAGTGLCTCYLAAFIAISWIFRSDAGFALVCLTAGSSVGQFFMPLVIEACISRYTWSGAYIVISALPLQCLACGLLIHSSSEFYVTSNTSADGDQAGKTDNDKKTNRSKGAFRSLLTDVTILLLLVTYFMMSLTGNAEAWFIVDMVVTRGFTRQSGSVIASAIGMANFIGRMLGTLLRYKMPNTPTLYHWIYLCPLTAVTHALVVIFHDYTGIFCSCVAYGVIYGISVAQAPAIMFETAGLDRYPQGMALVNTMYGIGNILSGLLGGFIRDSTGQYDIVFWLAVGTTLYNGLGAALAAYLIRKKGRDNRMNDEISVRYRRLSD
ncbi:monocarboxylate transporter 3-like [Mya arenaria]|uniref:monocarboxylate transporter 3-like n=1 Tax=Mya arenaria TaxID=6604 RepID=UPI0022E0BE7C|nr:monocarboxylate transporter 3-like [Mya arenaria]